jgi:hypothetical protein
MTTVRARVKNLLVALLLLVPCSVPAQLSPPDPRQPYNGLWWDPLESGTGVTISTQGRLLVALIYTYRADGNPLWLLASGELNAGVFEAPLIEFRAGQCLGCAYSAPQIANDSRRLRLEFLSNTVGSMRIDAGTPDRISFFPFGVRLLPFETISRSQSRFSEPWMPDVFGCWVFVSADPDRSFRRDYRFHITTGPPTPLAPGAADYRSATAASVASNSFDLLSCVGRPSNGLQAPYCEMRHDVLFGQQSATRPVVWSALLGDIGPDRIVAFEGEAPVVDPNVANPRGEHLIYGFRFARGTVGTNQLGVGNPPSPRCIQ